MKTLKEIFFPARPEMKLAAYESWVVEYTARYDGYSFGTKQVFEVFTNEEDAEKFAAELRKAYKLTKNTFDDNVKKYRMKN
jgi:hypothetical protein